MKIQMTKTSYTKNPNTKTTYNVEKVESKEISRTHYNNITDTRTLQWFRRLGGSETARKSYTCRGYLITKLTSVSPDRSLKSVYKFKFS